AAKAGIRPFVGPQRGPFAPHEADKGMWLGAVLLALLGLVCGLATGPMSQVVAAAIQPIAQRPLKVELAFWHGFNLPLLLSIATLLGGGLLFAGRQRVLAATERLRALGQWGPDRAYGLTLDALNIVARAQ